MRLLYLLGMKFDKIYQHDTQFLSVTSLLPEEFDVLCEAFKPRWMQWYKHFTEVPPIVQPRPGEIKTTYG